MRSEFAGLLQPAQMAEATDDFHAALSDLASSLAGHVDDVTARKAHRLITYAIVFGREGLEAGCRAFEEAVVDNRGIGSARGRLASEIEKVMAEARQIPVGVS